MIKRPSDLLPRFMIDEFSRLAQIPGRCASIVELEPPRFACKWHKTTWLQQMCAKESAGADIVSFVAFEAWMREGPKIVHCTPEQFRALSEVEVNVELPDLTLPYPTVFVDLSDIPGHVHTGCLVHRYSENILVTTSKSHGHLNDISTVVRNTPGHPVEKSLEKCFDMKEIETESCQTQRVALNLLLCMTHFGCDMRAMFPAEVERDERLSQQRVNPERADKARRRLAEAPQEVKFIHEVQLWQSPGGNGHGPGDGNGSEKSFHWRRGHWAMVPCGEGRAERRRVFRKPCMVRPDLIVGTPEQHTTVYE